MWKTFKERINGIETLILIPEDRLEMLSEDNPRHEQARDAIVVNTEAAVATLVDEVKNFVGYRD